MENFQVYRDIQARTGGDIYIGVVGPVRTGKSTFIRRFMEVVALPQMSESRQAEIRDQRIRKDHYYRRNKIYSQRSNSHHSWRRPESKDTPDRQRGISGKRRLRTYRRGQRANGKNSLV